MRKPCCDKQDTNKGAWSKQEDQKLIDYIQTHGEGCWRSLPKFAGLLRCGKSCRLRWINYLRPDLKRGNFGQDEEDLIIKLHALLGNRWSLIAGRLPGRTDNEVKNYWNSHLKKKLIKMGIDPNNHRLNNTTRNLPLPPQSPKKSCPVSSSSATSTDKSMAKDSCKPLKSSFGNGEDDNDRLSSNPTSCLEDETPGSLDLNLELTMAVPCPISISMVKKQENVEGTINGEHNQICDPVPTLPLFR